MELSEMGLFKPKRDESSISRLPYEWNKDSFHMVNINDNGKSYVGYFWATNNWVEIHCFKKVSLETVYSKTEYMTYVHDQLVNKLWANFGFVFEKRVLSAIVPRRPVKFSYLLNSKEFYSNKYRFKDTIYVNVNKSDIDRWKKWHPDDLYKHVLPGDKEIGWYAICDNNLYKLEWALYSLIGEVKQTDGSYNDDLTLKVKHKSTSGIKTGYVCTNSQGYRIYRGEREYERTGIMIPAYYVGDENGKPRMLDLRWQNGEWIVDEHRDWTGW